ncbi:MAG: glycosyltransferase family 4 protein [Flavisolibacter sp.]
MKILFIHNRYQYQGGEDAILEAEVSLLKQKGHELRVIRFDNEQIKGVFSKITTGFHSFYNPVSAKKAEEVMKDFTPDLVHIHNLFFTASPSVLFKAHRLKIPVVMTLHNYRLICANAMLLREEKICEQCVQKIFPLDGIRHKCYRSSFMESALVTGITSLHKVLSTWQNKVSRYIVLAEFAKTRILNSSLRIAEEKISVKPNFVADPQKIPDSRQDYFLFVGRIASGKGVELLLQTFSALPDLRLVMAGDGPDRERLETAISQIPNVQYLGQQPAEKILELMRQCRALVFPSNWYEGLPTVIIEAFATGTPVIASRLGAMAEMVEHGYNGLHFEANNSEDLKEKLISLPRYGEKIYQQARLSYEKKYHPDVHYKAILSIYQQAIEARKNEE